MTTEDSPVPPDLPGDLPDYVRDGLEARTPEQLRAIARWAESLADYRERALSAELERPPEDGDVAASHRYAADDLPRDLGSDDFADASGTVYLYWIRTHCNKDSCSTCPHGPYPYLKYRVGDTVRTRYGKEVAAALGVGPPE